MIGGKAFREMWAVDFEFRAPPGHNPEPLCMVAKELLSGHTIRQWQDALRAAASYAARIDRGSRALYREEFR